MVPASTLMYGSIFWSVTRKPRASRSDPIGAPASPLPRDDTTPPVTKMYFVVNSASFRQPASDVLFFHRAGRDRAVQARVPDRGEDPRPRRTPRDPEGDHVVARQRRGPAGDAREPVEGAADGPVAAEPVPREL